MSLFIVPLLMDACVKIEDFDCFFDARIIGPDRLKYRLTLADFMLGVYKHSHTMGTDFEWTAHSITSPLEDGSYTMCMDEHIEITGEDKSESDQEGSVHG